MNSLALFMLVLALAGCAKTEFFYQGQKVAVFQGDMARSNFTMTITDRGVVIGWGVEAVSHSEATRAQGDSAAAKIGAAASVITAGVAAAALIP